MYNDCRLKKSCKLYTDTGENCPRTINGYIDDTHCSVLMERIIEVLKNDGIKENYRCKHFSKDSKCNLFPDLTKDWMPRQEWYPHACQTNPLNCNTLIIYYYMETGKCKYFKGIVGTEIVCEEKNDRMVDVKYYRYRCSVANASSVYEGHADKFVEGTNRSDTWFPDSICDCTQKKQCLAYKAARKTELGMI